MDLNAAGTDRMRLVIPDKASKNLENIARTGWLTLSVMSRHQELEFAGVAHHGSTDQMSLTHAADPIVRSDTRMTSGTYWESKRATKTPEWLG